jgi:hypothetical protein
MNGHPACRRATRSHGALEDEVAELREAVEEGGGGEQLEGRVEELEEAVEEQRELSSELCAELELIC